ncbi:hypothetical protein GCM10007049_03500 [Echinicola pacifica]|uniref:BFN domain-containing protein n=2 Tax=Echinicola pacifica TaxID=346377 RepID=A0A918PM18_9BACT|nr:hypothetical protein GCM10007049_03500 [Echinicola pacifica]
MFEAQAIAIEIEKIVPNRPMTHDLFKSFASNFGFNIDYILISDMREGVFYAKIVCKDGRKVVEIDARPSDAIAIAVRFEAPIYCEQKVMSEAAIEFNENEEEVSPDAASSSPSKPVSKPAKSNEPWKDYSLDKLNEMLDKAITNENYEQAARIRDEINRRN